MPSSWKIRILNTSHQGAEVIVNQTMLLGSDEDIVDLVISEDYIEPKHLEIIPNKSGVILKSLVDQVKVHTVDSVIDSDKIAPTQTPIFVGRLLIAIAPVNQSWSDKLDQRERAHLAPPVSTLKNELPHDNPTSSSRKTVISVACALSLLIALSFSLFDGSLHNAQLTKSTSDNNSLNKKNESTESFKQKKLAEQEDSKTFTYELVQNEFPMVEFLKHNNTLVVSGYVRSQRKYSELIQKLSNIDGVYEFRVQNMEDIKSDALLILENLNLSPVALEITESPGSLRAVIDGKNISAWRRAEVILKKDISGLRSWELEVPQPVSPIDQLNTLITETSLNGKITLEDKGDSINMIARLNSGQSQLLNNVVLQFRNRVGDIPKLVQITPNPQKKAPSLEDLGIRAVRSGKSPYVTLNDGKRYLPGSRLPDGNSLTDIEEGYIRITSDQKSFDVRYDIEPALGKRALDISYKGK